MSAALRQLVAESGAPLIERDRRFKGLTPQGRALLDWAALDAGITYLDNEPLHGVRATPLYEERYILLTPAPGPFSRRTTVTWREAAETPLCLLTPDMQNRRIVDGVFREIGKTPRVLVETNSVMTLCSHIRTGAWSSVFPHNFLWVFGTPPGMLALLLVEPVRTHMIGLTPMPVLSALGHFPEDFDRAASAAA